MKYANLHFHSTHSDGGYRPAHLALLAKSMGYGAVALTDHDVFTGFPELYSMAKAVGLEAISGVEFEAIVESGDDFHIVGLDFDTENKRIKEFSRYLTDIRNQYTKKQFEYAAECGIIKGITWNDVLTLNKGCNWFCNEQVINAMDLMGLVPFAESDEIRVRAFCSKEAYSVAPEIFKKMFTPAKEVIDVIHEAGGVAVLAHPVENALSFVPEFVKLGIDGIEVSHPGMLEEECEGAYQAARKYNLYCSGGTDHNGIMGASYGSSRGGRIERSDEVYSGAEREEFYGILNRKK